VAIGVGDRGHTDITDHDAPFVPAARSHEPSEQDVGPHRGKGEAVVVTANWQRSVLIDDEERRPGLRGRTVRGDIVAHRVHHPLTNRMEATVLMLGNELAA